MKRHLVVGLLSSFLLLGLSGLALWVDGSPGLIADEFLLDGLSNADGSKQAKWVREQDISIVLREAHLRGIPILEIDPSDVDTTQFFGMYEYWATVPLSNRLGLPLVIGDVDRNGDPELYGVFNEPGQINFSSRIFQLDSTGSPSQLHLYDPFVGSSEQIVDADGDSLLEVMWTYFDTLSNFEQQSYSGLPIEHNFSFAKYEAGSPGYTPSVLRPFDQDSAMDLLYKSTWYDLMDTTIVHRGIAIAEYRIAENNFHRLWSYCPYCSDSLGLDFGGFSSGDFDSDGAIEFAASYTEGVTQIFENTGDDKFEKVWTDSFPLVNLVYGASGDVDGDGRAENFRGATMSNGSWTIVYESDGNNQHSAKFLIHLLGSGTFTEPTYTTADMDSDGVPELIVLNGEHFFVFKSLNDNSYDLFYYRSIPYAESVSSYTFNGDTFRSFVVTKSVPDSLGYPMLAAEVWRPGLIPSVNGDSEWIPTSPVLFQNYPNPFNGATRIRYVLGSQGQVEVTIVDLLGQVVATLVREKQSPRSYEVDWQPHNLPSGIYFCRLSTSGGVWIRKMVFMK